MIFGTESALQFFTKVARHATLAFGALRAPLGTIIHHSGGNDVKFGNFHYLGIFSGISGSHVAWAQAKAMWPRSRAPWARPVAPMPHVRP